MFNPNGADSASVNLESETPATGGLLAYGLRAFPSREQI
jgi:hypothetical protein